jgi:hypothetical protein
MVGRAGVLGDEQQHAPVRYLEYGQQTPGTVQVKSADPRQDFTRQPDTGSRTSAAAYVLDRYAERGPGLAAQGRDLLAGQLRRNCRDSQRGSCVAGLPS